MFYFKLIEETKHADHNYLKEIFLILFILSYLINKIF